MSLIDAISALAVVAALILLIALAEHRNRTRFRVLTSLEGQRVTLGVVVLFGRLRLNYEIDATILGVGSALHNRCGRVLFKRAANRRW